MDFLGKELQDWTVGDWLDAKTGLTNSAFRKRIRVAAAGSIQIPSLVLPDRTPRILFEDKTGSDFSLAERVKDEDAVNRFNSGIRNWANKVAGELRASADRTFAGRDASQVNALQPRLSESIRPNVRFDQKFMLETRSVGFSLARHGVFLHHGAGTGHGGVVGSSWTDLHGNLKRTNPQSLGKAGTGSRNAEHWFNSVIERNASELTDIVAEYSLDITVNMAKIMLP